MVATRASVDRCGSGHVVAPLSPTGTEEGQGRGGGERVALYGQGPEDSSSPADTLQPVRKEPGGGPQERGAHAGDVCARTVPQPVDQLVEVLRRIATVVPEQVIEVPKITSQNVIPQRAVLRVPQMAEQQVDEPLPSFHHFELVEEEEEEEEEAASGPGVVRLDADSRAWCQVSSVRRGPLDSG